MQHHIRIMVAASAYALVTGRKVAGMHDHLVGQDLQIAAEARDRRVQGYDGKRDVRFGGTLPELRCADAMIHMTIEEGTAQGYDRSTSGHFTTKIAELRVQLYDHAEGMWFTFDVHTA